MEEPVACSLDADDTGRRLDEWRAVGALTTRMERPRATVLVADLEATEAELSALTGLVRREVDCCPFFSFALTVGAHRTTLTATVPEDAAPVLDGFATLLGG